MSFVVTITSQAEADIDRNATWWADHHSIEQAVTWLQTLREQIESLSTMPERYSVAPENHVFNYEIRQCSVGLGARPSYRAIYTIVDQRVLVLTIRRGAEDAIRADELPPSVQ